MTSDNTMSHITTVSASIEKIYNHSRVTGKLESTDLYLLEAINKFLTGCTMSTSTWQKRKLFDLYTSISGTSPFICRLVNIVPNIIKKKSDFVQAASPTYTQIYTNVFNQTFQ